MSLSKSNLLAATAALGMIAAASPAVAAPILYNAAEIRSNGASAIANVLAVEFTCFGGDEATKGTPNDAAEPLGFSNDTFLFLPGHDYQPTKPTTGNPVYDCTTQSVQKDVVARYISTGSGTGRSNWRDFVANAASSNPFVGGPYDTDTWNNIHIAFSETPLSSGDITTYETNTGADLGAGTGPDGTAMAIQIPLYVVPVGFSYDPIYAKRRTATGITNLAFRLKTPHLDNSGGMRMKKRTYCKIVNGEITNFNHADLTADNGNQTLMDLSDDLTRWNTVGVPIRLVGRSETSGTSTIFNRHLSSVCGLNAASQVPAYTGPNAWINGGQDLLPYDGTITIAGTGYTSLTGNGTTNSISGAFYNKTTDTISGTETLGKFMVANGNDGVAEAVGFHPDPTLTVGNVSLNGKLGYNAGDWVLPSILSQTGLHSADLQVGTGSSYAAVTAANATAAFAGSLPPESTSAGKYVASGACAVDGENTAGCRKNPAAWVQGPEASAPNANPSKGFPMIGTSNALLYTCYASADTRTALVGFLGLHIGKVTTDWNGDKVPAKLVTSTAKGVGGLQVGILPRNGIAPLPTAWVNAIYETFLTKTTSGANPSNLGLWIQSKLPTKTADIPLLLSNPVCVGGTGA